MSKDFIYTWIVSAVVIFVALTVKDVFLENVNLKEQLQTANERTSAEFEMDLERVTSLLKENQHLKDQLELIQTIKNEQCDLLPEPVKVGE